MSKPRKTRKQFEEWKIESEILKKDRNRNPYDEQSGCDACSGDWCTDCYGPDVRCRTCDEYIENPRMGHCNKCIIAYNKNKKSRKFKI